MHERKPSEDDPSGADAIGYEEREVDFAYRDDEDRHALRICSAIAR
jgi:hypothetical protein